jgi:hypothetical protein
MGNDYEFKRCVYKGQSYLIEFGLSYILIKTQTCEKFVSICSFVQYCYRFVNILSQLLDSPNQNN